MNVCFAICITFLIFQNQQLKDQAGTLEGYAQIDTDKAFDRLDAIDEYLVDVRKVVNNNQSLIKDLITENDRHETNRAIFEKNDEIIFANVRKLEDYLIENFSGQLR